MAPELLCLHPPGPHLGLRCEMGDGGPGGDLGRASSAWLQVDNETLGRRHCHFIGDDDGWMVRHLGSTNGTRVYSADLDARSDCDAMDAWQGPGVVLRDGWIINPGGMFFRFVHREDAASFVARERLRLRLIDWLTGMLRADAFVASLASRADDEIVRVTLEPGHHSDWTWGSRWLWAAGALVHDYAGVDACVGYGQPATFLVATRRADEVADVLSRAFDGPWTTGIEGQEPPRATINIGPRDEVATTPPLLSPALAADLPACLECQGPLHLALARLGGEQLACVYCGGMFDLGVVADASSGA